MITINIIISLMDIIAIICIYFAFTLSFSIYVAYPGLRDLFMKDFAPTSVQTQMCKTKSVFTSQSPGTFSRPA